MSFTDPPAAGPRPGASQAGARRHGTRTRAAPGPACCYLMSRGRPVQLEAPHQSARRDADGAGLIVARVDRLSRPRSQRRPVRDPSVVGRRQRIHGQHRNTSLVGQVFEVSTGRRQHADQSAASDTARGTLAASHRKYASESCCFRFATFISTAAWTAYSTASPVRPSQ